MAGPLDDKKALLGVVPPAKRPAAPGAEAAPATVPDPAPPNENKPPGARTERSPGLAAFLEQLSDPPAAGPGVVRVSDLPMPPAARAPAVAPAPLPEEKTPPPREETPSPPRESEARSERAAQGPLPPSQAFAAQPPPRARSGPSPSPSKEAQRAAASADLQSLVLEPVPAAEPAAAEPATTSPASGPVAPVAADEVVPFPDGWDSYQNRGLLGSGHMGTVYRGYDPLLKRMVALRFCADSARGARLRREAAAQADLQHPNVCRVYEVGEVGGCTFVAMQLLQGPTLPKAAVSMSLAQKVSVMVALCEALDAAHRLGLVHRNLTPSSIVVERGKDGALHPYVLDFGLALDHREAGHTDGAVAGALTYMSPEQARGDSAAIDRRADVYSLGALLYTIVGDRPPYQGSTPIELAARVSSESPPPLSSVGVVVPPALEAIVVRALERRPERRFQTAQSMARELRRFLDTEASRSKRKPLALRKHARLASFAALALVVLAVAGGLALRVRLQKRTAARFIDRLIETVYDIDARMRLAHALPAHDLRPQRGELRAQLVALEAEMGRVDPLVTARSHHALGRGYLALSDLRLAREHLEQAWAAGERTPSLAQALGELHARLHADQERGNPAQTGGGGGDGTGNTEAPDVLRGKALEYLRMSRDGGGRPGDLLRAQMLALEGKREEALALARTAFARDPLLFEARVFEGNQLSVSGRIAEDEGDFDRARDLYQQAEKSLRAAVDQARSYPPAYLELCRVLHRQARLPGAGREHLLDAAAVVCRAGTAIDPDDPALAARTGSVLSGVAEQRLARGQVPAGLDEAQALIEAAITRDPRRIQSYRDLCDLLRVRGELAAGRGQDARPHFSAALDAIARGLRAAPSEKETATLLVGEALVRLAAARDGYWHGREAEAEASLHEATATIGRVRGIDPDDYVALTLAAAARALSLHYGTEGESPRAAALVEAGLGDAHAAVRRSHAQDAAALALLADLEVLESRPAGTRRRAPASLVAAGRALADARRAVAANSELAASWRAVALAEMAVYLAQGGADARHGAESSAAIERAVELCPGDADLHLTRAGLALDRDGPEAAQRARQAIDAALAIDPSRVLGPLCAVADRKDCR